MRHLLAAAVGNADDVRRPATTLNGSPTICGEVPRPKPNVNLPGLARCAASSGTVFAATLGVHHSHATSRPSVHRANALMGSNPEIGNRIPP